MAEEIAWFVGIDWASQSHQVCLVDARGECLGERAVAHGGLGIEELCDWLIAVTGATPEVIGVAIEMTHGPVGERGNLFGPDFPPRFPMLAVAVQRDRAANWLFALSSFQPPDDLARQSVGPARRALRQGIARTTEVAALLMFRARRRPGRA